MLFDVNKVFYHTHAIFCPVTFIQVLEATAGKLLTFIAVLNAAFPQELTALFYKSAVLTAGAAAGAVSLQDAGAAKVMSHGEIAAAQGAVHAARGD
jgi:hypothetical protein